MLCLYARCSLSIYVFLGLAGYDVGEGRPILRAYMERVRADLHPHYDEVMVRFNKFISKYTKTTSLKAKL